MKNENATAEKHILADYRLFLLSLEEEYPGLRDEMCQIAAKDPQMNALLEILNYEYRAFCSARRSENIPEVQIAAANALDVLKQLFDNGVLPYFESKASRMAGVQFVGFTFIKH